MEPIVELRRAEIERLCKSHRVRKLELFGSAATGGFDPRNSDLDFLVEFERMEPVEYAEAYFGLLEGLEDLFGLPVDLVVERSIDNPYFLRSIQATRTPLHAA